MDVTVTAACSLGVGALVGAAVQGSIGFGMNLVLAPVVALVLPDALPGVLVLLAFPSTVMMVRHERHALDRRGVGWILLGRIPGTAAGVWVVHTLDRDALAILVGVLVLLAVVASVAAPPIPARPRTQVLAGVLSGTTGTAAGIGGPPLALLYQHHAGPTMRSTLAASFFFGTMLSVATLGAAGEIHALDLELALAFAPLVVAGSYAGRRLHAALDRGWLRPTVLVFAAISAVVVIADASR